VICCVDSGQETRQTSSGCLMGALGIHQHMRFINDLGMSEN